VVMGTVTHRRISAILVALGAISSLTVYPAGQCLGKQSEPRKIALDPSSRPDITISDLSVTDGKTRSGSTILVKFRPRITGVVAGSFACDVHLTADRNRTTDKTRIATRMVRPGVSHDTEPMVVEYTVPVGSKERRDYVVVVADPDNQIEESNERNNDAAKSLVAVDKPAGPARAQTPTFESGVAVDHLVLSKTSAMNDEHINVLFDIKNTGQTRLTEIPYEIYLEAEQYVVTSNGRILTVPARIPLQGGVARNLAPGSTTPMNVEIVVPWNLIPAPTGNKLHVKLDSAWRMGDDRSDNAAFVNILITVDKRPDFALTLTGRDVGNTVSYGALCKKATISYQITNAGNRLAPDSKCMIIVTKKENLGWQQVGVDEIRVGRLHSGESIDESLSFTVREGNYGRYRVVIYADSGCDYVESAEMNNSMQVLVDVPDPTP